MFFALLLGLLARLLFRPAHPPPVDHIGRTIGELLEALRVPSVPTPHPVASSITVTQPLTIALVTHIALPTPVTSDDWKLPNFLRR